MDTPPDVNNPAANTPTDVAGALSAASTGSGAAAVTGAVRPVKPTLDPFGLRALIISWCLWLLVSWSITLAIGATVHAVRWVVFSAVFGLMAVWPAIRLSQQLPGRFSGGLSGRCEDTAGGDRKSSGHVKCGVSTSSTRVLATMLDWVCLVLVFQVVVWPLMLVAHWSLEQTLWLDLAVVFWSLLSAVLVGLGRVLPMPGVRVGAMLLCMLLLVGEPAWMAMVGEGFDTAGIATGVGRSGWDWQMRISPLQALWELTTTVQPYDPSAWRPTILSTAAASGLGWLALWGMALWGRNEPQ